jgi:hypothetical protein
VVVETVFIQTIDGVEIEADIIRTDAVTPRAVVIIGHPHPLYGGDHTAMWCVHCKKLLHGLTAIPSPSIFGALVTQEAFMMMATRND